MALAVVSFFTTPVPLLCIHCSLHPCFPSSSSSLLRFHLLPPPRPRLSSSPSSSSCARTRCVSAVPSPVFLPHLQDPSHPSGSDGYEEDEEEDDESMAAVLGVTEPPPGEEEEEEDPIINFFRSRAPPPDPRREGRLTLQRNRRTAWHIADDPLNDVGDWDAGENAIDPQELHAGDPVVECSSPEGRGGVVEEVMRIARSLPENTTLGDVLDPFVGKLGEGECIELLRSMGEEGEGGMVRNCLYLFEWMGLQEPSLITPRACSILFPVLGRARMGDMMMVLFENLPKAKRFRDVCVYNSAISALAYCGRYDDAWKVYEMLEANNVKPDHVTCSILITVMRKAGRHAKDAWQFVERMNRKGVKWSVEVTGTLIKSFCDEGLKKQALVIQSEMEKKGILSNTIIYNTLMDAYSKSAQVEEAEGLFLEMKEKGLKPTTVTYNILMDAYSRRMQPDVIEKLMSEMQDIGLKPNVKSYTCLISAYGRKKTMSDMAADSFLRMKKAGIKPTSHSYTALIHAYSVGGWHEKAYAAFGNMKREGISPSIETYTTLLDAFRRAGDTEKLLEIWKLMIKNKVEATRVTFNIVLHAMAKNGLYVEARDVIYEFGRMGLQPTVMTYNMLMDAYARGGQHFKLPQLLKEMASLELKPDSVTYSTIIYAYVRVRDFSRAFHYHKQMVKSGQIPEFRSYQKLRAILDTKAKTKNRRDRSAILGIVNSKFGLKPKKGKKDEFWKNKRKRSMSSRSIDSRE